uniref:Protein kinase domain-containing protein n=1 Tax=Coccolithus braarudii TaxID=221442 RepID=A0A7S0L238_9EUKA
MLPLVLSLPLTRFATVSEAWWWWCVRISESSGALVIKLAQWASSRPDLFGSQVCARFSHLQDQTPTHAWRHTEGALDEAFGGSWREELSLDESPIGSGCIAQVYRGELRAADGSRSPVAVKVLHPDVERFVQADMNLLHLVAWAVHCSGRLRWLNPMGMADEFSGMLLRQLDLTLEAGNLRTFTANFAIGSGDPLVFFPVPIDSYVSPKVLVETFIEGEPLLTWAARTPEDAPVRQGMMNDGIDAFCKMLFTDNFFHGDLHPGNIFVTPSGKLAFLDAGIAVEYTERDHQMLIEILSRFIQYDGYGGGLKMLEQTDSQDEVSDAHGFCTKIAEMVFKARADPTFFDQVGAHISVICNAACDHHVLIAQGFISVALSVKVVEGAVIQVDPEAVVAPRARGVIMREAIRRKLWRRKSKD